jgi:N-acetyltransferase 10
MEQVLSNFIKTMKKLYGFLHNVAGKEIEVTLPQLKGVSNLLTSNQRIIMLVGNSWLDMFCYVQIEMTPLSKSMDEDLVEAAKEVEMRFRLSFLSSLTC